MNSADFSNWFAALLPRLPLIGLLPCVLGADLRFLDVSSESGVAFHHAASKQPPKFLVETMGAGVALIDYDGDGLWDLYFVNGADLSNVSEVKGPEKAAERFWNRLYKNLGDWRFEDVTGSAGVAGRGYGMGAAVADYDGDGDSDLFVTNFGPDLLYRNDGSGKFTEVSTAAGIRGGGWSAGAAFADFDNDGHLDLFVAQYLEWSFGASKPCGEGRPDRLSYCHPREFGPVTHRVYRNLGDGRFEDASVRMGIADHPGKGLGVALNDFDGDGWVDVFVANDSYPQQLFLNKRGARFEEVAIRLGAAYDAEGRDYAGMGVVWQDFDGDLRPDLLVNALGRQGYWLYRHLGDRFEPASELSGVAALSELRSGWGMGLVDFDNDGWRDLLVGQGHVMDDIEHSDEALAHEEPILLARNLFGRFFDVSSKAGPAFERRLAARGVAFGDLDGDGRVDAVVNVNDGEALILRNQSDAGHSITVRLEGAGLNRDAIGASVRVRTEDGREQHGFRASAGSYLSSNADDLHFGLGDSGRAERVQVWWPNGSTQAVSGQTSGLVVIRQPAAGSKASR
ncbi:MAG: CRTAC1 family protein [Acidobacteriia bacterium]|nr:CRTAC1 family protein [Terriglobia bacterium]MYC66073.1 CRTAC1 family protein [Terriglobia bacterium]MYG01251.1 CRTAC1 family protein [Terriglobia bacterium]MYK11527.1 CRTAC1 family protein [Terriglobia bacterium]